MSGSRVFVFFAAFFMLTALVACDAMTGNKAEKIFQGNKTWFERVVKELSASLEISSIQKVGSPFDEKEQQRLGEADRRIYLAVQSGMKEAFVERIDLGRATGKDWVEFVMDRPLYDTGATTLAAVNSETVMERLRLPNEECRPIITGRWYVCRLH